MSAVYNTYCNKPSFSYLNTKQQNVATVLTKMASRMLHLIACIFSLFSLKYAEITFIISWYEHIQLGNVLKGCVKWRRITQHHHKMTPTLKVFFMS